MTEDHQPDTSALTAGAGLAKISAGLVDRRGWEIVADLDVTEEQQEIARLMVAGLTDDEIARRLLCSRRTLHRQMERLMSQHDLPNRAALGAFAASRGWLTEYPPAHARGRR